jgi:hypothetical protein
MRMQKRAKFSTTYASSPAQFRQGDDFGVTYFENKVWLYADRLHSEFDCTSEALPFRRLLEIFKSHSFVTRRTKRVSDSMSLRGERRPATFRA